MKYSVYRIANRRGCRPRRLLAHAWLILALLVTQIGALTHTLTHHFAPDEARLQLSDASGLSADSPNKNSDRAQPQHDACALCSALAASGAALAAQPLAITASSQTHTLFRFETRSTSAPPFSFFSSRAPPAALS
jgi:hypothetical protein